MAVVFDTLKFANKLKAAGVPDKQAEAIAQAFQEASGETLAANIKDLVTKQDLRELELHLKEETGKLDVRMTRLEADMTWLKRLAWAILGAAVVQLARSFGVI